MNRNKIVLFLLITLFSVVRFVILIYSDNFAGGVPMGIVSNSLSVLENPSFRANFDPAVSVLHKYMLAGVLYLWRDPLITPRIFSVIFGILLVMPFYFLIKILFDEKIAFYSSILLAFAPLHVIQSSISTTDVIYYYFFFYCLYYLFKFKFKQKRLAWLILSAIFFNIASVLRLESWIFIPLLSVFLYKDGKRYLISFFLLSLILPFTWIYLSYHYTGDPFYTFNAAIRTSHTEILIRAPHSKEILGWFRILCKTLGGIVSVSGVFGMAYSFIKRRAWHLAVLFICLYCYYTINTIMMRMWYVERYSIFLGILMLPYAVFLIKEIAVISKLNLSLLLLPFIIFSAMTFKGIIKTSISRLAPEVKEIAAWLKHNALKSDKIILGTDSWDATDNDIIVRSGVSPSNFFVVTKNLAHPEQDLNLIERIEYFIVTKSPRYLILFSTGFLAKYLNLDMDNISSSAFGRSLKLVYFQDIPVFGRANVYEVNYK